MYQDFDRQEAPAKEEVKQEGEENKAQEEEGAIAPAPLASNETKCGLLEESAIGIGISNKSHPKCMNSIQIMIMTSSVNQMV